MFSAFLVRYKKNKSSCYSENLRIFDRFLKASPHAYGFRQSDLSQRQRT